MKNYIIDTATIYYDDTIEYDENGNPLPKCIHLNVEMDGFEFDTKNDQISVKELLQQLIDYKTIMTELEREV